MTDELKGEIEPVWFSTKMRWLCNTGLGLTLVSTIFTIVFGLEWF